MSARESPIPYYDQLARGSIEAHIRELDPDELHELLDYERTYAGRAPILQLIRERLDDVPHRAPRSHA